MLIATREAQLVAKLDTKYDSKSSIDYLDKTFKLKISSAGMEINHTQLVTARNYHKGAYQVKWLNVTYQQCHDFHESLNQSPTECLQEKYSGQQDKLFLHQVFWSLCGVSGFP